MFTLEDDIQSIKETLVEVSQETFEQRAELNETLKEIAHDLHTVATLLTQVVSQPIQVTYE